MDSLQTQSSYLYNLNCQTIEVFIKKDEYKYINFTGGNIDNYLI